MAEGRAPFWLRVDRVYREKGLGGLWFAALSRTGYRRLIVFERRLDEPIVQVLPRVEAEIRPLRSDDEAAFEGLGQEGAALFRRRLEAGHQGWGAWSGGGLRHTRWCALRETHVEYLRCRLVLEDDVAYIYRSFTQPQYRNLGLAPATGAACLQALRERGFRAMLAAVLPENPAAIAPALRLGYRRVGVVRSIGGGRRPLVAVALDRGADGAHGWAFLRSSGDGPGDAAGPV